MGRLPLLQLRTRTSKQRRETVAEKSPIRRALAALVLSAVSLIRSGPGGAWAGEVELDAMQGKVMAEGANGIALRKGGVTDDQTRCSRRSCLTVC
jgi:hypothetical protein